MPVSVEFLERAAAETGFQAAMLEKVVRLGELADDVARPPLLGPAHAALVVACGAVAVLRRAA